MEDDNLLAEVIIRSGIRMERNLWSGKRMTDTTLCFLSLKKRSLVFFIKFTDSLNMRHLC